MRVTAILFPEGEHSQNFSICVTYSVLIWLNLNNADNMFIKE